MTLRTLDAEALVNGWREDPIDTWRKQQKARQYIKPRQRDPNHEFGDEITAKIAGKLEEMGYIVETTSHKAHHDLLVNGRLRIEVKAALWTRDRQGDQRRGRYQANLRKNRADLYIFVARNGRDHAFIIPAEAVAGQRSLTIRTNNPRHYTGRLARYYEAWGLVGEALASVAGRPRQEKLNV